MRAMVNVYLILNSFAVIVFVILTQADLKFCIKTRGGRPPAYSGPDDGCEHIPIGESKEWPK